LYPDAADLPDDFAMPIWDHLDELRERVLVAAGAATLAVGLCFAGARDLVVFLEAPVASQGVRFLQLSPGEFFFTTLKVSRTRRGEESERMREGVVVRRAPPSLPPSPPPPPPLSPANKTTHPILFLTPFFFFLSF
jgi:hypothetical protein